MNYEEPRRDIIDRKLQPRRHNNNHRHSRGRSDERQQTDVSRRKSTSRSPPLRSRDQVKANEKGDKASVGTTRTTSIRDEPRSNAQSQGSRPPPHRSDCHASSTQRRGSLTTKKIGSSEKKNHIETRRSQRSKRNHSTKNKGTKMLQKSRRGKTGKWSTRIRNVETVFTQFV